MTLIKFIKYKLSENTPIGDLANDIKNSTDFPADKTEEEMLSFLEFKTHMGGSNDAYKSFLKEYKNHKLSNSVDSNIENILEEATILKSERWKYYKEAFSIDKVYLIGEPEKIYKVYCADSKRQIALLFSLESNSHLNDIALIEECDIYIGDLTNTTSVHNAIDSLSSKNYIDDHELNKHKLTELLDFLKRNNN